MAGISAPPPPPSSPAVDPLSGYCSETKTFHSIRPPAPLPPADAPISVAAYAFSLLPSPLPSNLALVDAATGAAVSFPDFLSQVRSLSRALTSQLGLAAGDVAFILAPSRIDVPVLYFALLSIGAIASPANPVSTPDEISRQILLSRPAVAFTVSQIASKLPSDLPTVHLDSAAFQSMLRGGGGAAAAPAQPAAVKQSDAAAILYSSGTTGRVKGVVLSHRNFTAIVASYYHAASAEERALEGPAVALFTIPLFHVFGFFMAIRAVALGETTVLMGRFDMGTMLMAVEKYRVTYIPVSPPLVVALVKSEEAARRDMSSLRTVGCGGAPLGKDVAEQFAARFPGVEIVQGYGLTESAGSATTMAAGEAADAVHGSAGRLTAGMEARIVDPATGGALPPGQQGELWLRGPTIMKGYIGDEEATTSTLDPEGWLKTGDLCYFNDEGLIFIVDRLKELIKYKAYQVPPAELEHILHSHPEIADAAVIPYPHEEAGQIPMAYVVRQPGSKLNEEQVMDFVAKKVAPYKKVRRVAFVNSIPKSPAGKILRRELINHATSSPASKL